MDVPFKSVTVSAERLSYSIDTFEQAQSLNLRIIPPGPVVHTWYAEYGTGLFDEKNNPHHVEGLDYVTRVSEQADRLKEWGIPEIFVYLERDMPSPELRKMQEIFADHDNILSRWKIENEYFLFRSPVPAAKQPQKQTSDYLVMSLEGDLSSLKSIEYYKRPDATHLLDDPRFYLCREFPEVLSVAQKMAASVGKTLLLNNLQTLGGLSIIYSDIDNTFLRKPMFQLAAYGLRNVCTFLA